MAISTEKDGVESFRYPNNVNVISPTQELPTICTDVVSEHKIKRLMLDLEDEIAGLRLKQKSLDEKRREALHKIIDLKGSIRLFCRIRPYMARVWKTKHELILAGSEKIVVKSVGIRKEFEFDKVFSQSSTQEDVFVEVEPILRSAIDGHNVCILAYGQTGTGKTFTMEGTCDEPGIVPRALKELFSHAYLDSSAPITFSMSMLEVYMGNLKDLFAPRPSRRAYQAVLRCNLNIQTDPKGMVEIEGLTEVPISDFSKASWWYNKGKRARSTSCTNVNYMSSRSHCLTRITIFHHGDASEGGTKVSKLWMVDLGGSERLLKTGAIGQTLDEGRAINLSLSALGDVIAALRRRRCHVPYRNSKLTQILRDSLGDGSKVLMLVHASPCEEDLGETICSMSFAKRARGIESNQELPEEIKKQRQKKIVELTDELREADEEYQKVGNKLEKAKNLLAENKRLFSTKYQHIADEGMTPRSDKDESSDVQETPQASAKARRKNSLPRFMTSTEASRQRHNAAEREIDLRARILRLGTRSSAQLSASQSISQQDVRLKMIVVNSNSKQRNPENKAVAIENPQSNIMDSKSSSIPSRVTSSNPNPRAAVCRHRRRMSDLI
ncbi:hypothetical protein Nepgr_001469 [Nepenthes gracilis]|uniref:Kinesin motor domain-containing protein n=1 Tax=Nepenthes gracilis TaxID=150966 RepID=A0AAD3RXR9_NEPGR|nr:hypothetical protein Nepgr_001469 [Nepenthes gracilis]